MKKTMLKKISVYFRNMQLAKKMIFVYAVFLGIIVLITTGALQISLGIYDEKLYEKSLQELDFFSQKVNDSLQDVENLSYSIAMDTEIQEQLAKLDGLNELSAEYSYEMYVFRSMLINELYSHEIIKNITYTDRDNTTFTVGEDTGSINEMEYGQLLEDMAAGRGAYVEYPPTEDYPYMVSGRDILESLNASLDYLGSLIFVSDVSGLIQEKTEQLDVQSSALMVFSEDGMIYQGTEFDTSQLPDMEKSQGHEISRLGGQRYFICYLKSSLNGWTFVNLFPYSEIFGQVMLVRYLLVGGLLVLFAVTAIVMKKLAHIITRPLERLTDSMQVAETGDFRKAGEKVSAEMSAEPRLDEVGQLSQEFGVMMEKIDTLIHENYEKQILLKDTKYKMLQAQLNPHFLYNTLNALNWLVRAGRSQEAGMMIMRLGDLLRAAFSKKAYATVEEEVGLVKSYIAIQEIRYRSRAEFTVDVSGELSPYVIPRMTLQPLVENAISYGVDPSPETCRITVTVREEENDIFLEVRDTGPGMTADELEDVRNFRIKPRGNGIGLNNIQERLKIAYEESEFRIDSAPGEGTVVQIRIPKKREEEEDVQTADRG